jgi:serine/threonine protein kinase
MNDITQFTDFKELQDGTFATVWKCTCKLDNKKYAIKVLPYTDKKRRRVAMNEVFINRLLDHPYIVKMHAYFIHGERIYLVFDYYKKGDIFGRLPIDHKKIPLYMKQIIEALQYCHSRGVIHRDLKPENILLGDGHIALCDFGYGRKINPMYLKETRMNVKVGTPRFMSPEILRCGKKHTYDYLSDVWALGGVLADLHFIDDEGYYDSKNNPHCFLNISKGKWPRHKVSLECRDFITKCLKEKPKERITFTEMLKHPFILGRT